MVSERIELPVRLDGDLAADVEKHAAYVSAALLRVKVEADGRALSIEVSEGADLDALRSTLLRFVEAMTKRHRKLARRVVSQHRRKDEGPLARDVHAELLRRGWLFELGRGQLGLAGPALALARGLDAQCAELGRTRFGAVEQAFPALIPTGVLARCGYFASFPHSVSFVGHLVEDFDRIEEFRRANAESSGLTLENPASLAFEACLTPAVCYHAYQALEGRTLEAQGAVITSLGKCFRYESSNLVGLERLWDFTMREVIFVGTESQVATRRQSAIDAVVEQLERWDLDGSIETANDPFFPTTYATKKYWQVASELKFELRLAVEPAAEPRTIAAGSFNLHESFFGNAFGIRTADGTPAFTSCVGWGLERWVLACFTQHGFEPDRWPEAVRPLVFG